MLRKYAVRFILFGKSRTYIVQDLHTIDAIIQALELLEADMPDMVDAPGLCMIAKVWPEGAYLADEGEGPLIDTTKAPLILLLDPVDEVMAA
jgi:hypothetical protein